MELGGITVHKYAGLMVGRHDTDFLIGAILHDGIYKETKERILTTNGLILDEISMMSSKMFR